MIPDPLVYERFGTKTVFYAYRCLLGHITVETILYQAVQDWAAHHTDDLVGTSVKVYSKDFRNGRVSLVLIPSDRLTWGMWRSTLMGMGRFSAEGWREFSFNITDDASGGTPTGWGFLKASWHVEVAESKKRALPLPNNVSASRTTSG